MTTDERVVRYRETAAFIADRIHGEQPQAAIILGSGLGALADRIDNPTVIPYRDIPHFVHTTAVGHRGNLIFGTLGGKKVLAMQGRFHYYEGYSMQQVTYPVRVFAALGIGTLLVSNAAGGVNARYRVGDLMIICDHINMLPNPLIGPNVDAMGPRFLDMTRPYDAELIDTAEAIAAGRHIALHRGVYFGGTGATYETPAEYNFIRLIGADATGMSTVPEVIVARHCGMRVFGLSVITNQAHDCPAGYVNDGNEVVRAANAAARTMTELFTAMVERL